MLGRHKCRSNPRVPPEGPVPRAWLPGSTLGSWVPLSGMPNVGGIQACNFMKKRLQPRFFPVNTAKILRAAFFIEHLWWLLLNVLMVSKTELYFWMWNYFCKFHRKTRELSSLFNNVAGPRVQLYLKETPKQVFSCEICELLV